jgi:hypothetical protein
MTSAPPLPALRHAFDAARRAMPPARGKAQDSRRVLVAGDNDYVLGKNRDWAMLATSPQPLTDHRRKGTRMAFDVYRTSCARCHAPSTHGGA